MLQLRKRCGLFVILGGFRVFQNVLAVKGESGIRHLGERSFPFRRKHAGEMTMRIARIGPRQSVERGRDHELEISFRQDDVRIFPVQHLALLGDADLPGKRARWLRINSAVSRATATADRTAAAVKQAQLYAAFLRHLVQRAVGTKDLPGTGEHAAILVGVGIPQHHLLGVVPRFEELAITARLPQLAANHGCVAQIFDRFKQGHRHQARIVRSALDAHPAQPGQPNHIQNIFGARRTTDDVVPDSLRRSRLFSVQRWRETFR